jgi:galactose oxidase
MAVLANGKVLLWAACGTTFYGCHETTLMTLFDPGTDTRKKILTKSNTGPMTINTGQEYFCEATSILANGGVIVSGGVDLDHTSIADPNGNWTASSTLNIPRGYAGSTLTSNGQVFILGGSWASVGTDKMGELYTPGVGWRVLKNVSAAPFVTDDIVGEFRTDSHMWLFGASNGWVFHAGPARTMHWINTSGDGSVVSAGPRGSDSDAMTGNAVMYDINKIIALGGAPDYYGRPPSSNATLIDLSNGPGSGVNARSIVGMQNPRQYAHSIVLPNGQVMVAGGSGVGAMPFSDAGAVLQPELWDPALEKFFPLPAMVTPRAYHSVGFLLIDGRVMLAGGQLGAQDPSVIHTDAEIFTPPYLLNADGSDATRPTITSAPASTTAGQTINVKANGATSFVLVRVTSESHSVNNDQRRIPLTLNGTKSFKKVRVANTRAEEATTLKIPDDRGIVLPGTYYLFALDDNGTPSVASMMNIQ